MVSAKIGSKNDLRNLIEQTEEVSLDTKRQLLTEHGHIIGLVVQEQNGTGIWYKLPIKNDSRVLAVTRDVLTAYEMLEEKLYD